MLELVKPVLCYYELRNGDESFQVSPSLPATQ